ncbi:hypothetical protein RCL1_007960 [Eukaryota sp. TZLM3-RCL]
MKVRFRQFRITLNPNSKTKKRRCCALSPSTTSPTITRFLSPPLTTPVPTTSSSGTNSTLLPALPARVNSSTVHSPTRQNTVSAASSNVSTPMRINSVNSNVVHAQSFPIHVIQSAPKSYV